MAPKFQRNNLLVLIIFSMLIASALAYKKYRTINQLYFVVELQSSSNGNSQIFFDRGNGIREQDSRNVHVRRGGFQKYSFHVPSFIKSIRFDPINIPSVISIKNARIENAAGEKLKTFPNYSFKAIQQISKMDVNYDLLTVYTSENANDPIIVIENSSVDGRTSWVKFISQHVWIYAGYAFLTFVILKGLAKSRQEIAKVLDWFVNYAATNPKRTITLIGFIATILSCYPVVFFGKSFVHPVGVAALYSGPPYFPSFPINANGENFRGSDVGATSWCIAPNSVVQHDSIFHDFEFPFWNRYVGGGIPLFAQGQSMIGDVLHWIPVVLEGSAIGWDIKFLLSKAVFAVGMGLLVFRLTNTVLAGALIAVSSCFIGFFAFRFNHPAFFVLTYAPWVVLQWDRLGRKLASSNPCLRNCYMQGLLLAGVAWLQLNAGAPKEGVITACFIHTFGILNFLKHTTPKWGSNHSFAIASGIGFALAMITAPYWLLFLDTLGKSFTLYDTPVVNTYPVGMIIGFFDNFFFQKQLNNLLGPSVNLFVLCCMASSLLSLRIRQSRMVYGGWGLFTLAMAIAYGLIPATILIKIPFINKIQHVGNTFSVPMMIFALLLAGYGIRDFLLATRKSQMALIIFSLLCYLVLWIIFVLNGDTWKNTAIFFIVSFIIITVCVLQQCLKPNSGTWSSSVVIMLVCFIAVHVRHGMHLLTGKKQIDDYVLNPTQRPDFSNKSDAIQYVKAKIDKTMIPTRVVGEGLVLFPGFNSRLGLEGIVPVDAVKNKYYEKLWEIIDYPVPEWARGWVWLHILDSNQISSRVASLDLLGIGYILAEVGTLMPQGMKLMHSSDLDVWQRESVWPRAFFVNQVIATHKPADILDALADKAHTPFAAVETQIIPEEILKNDGPYQVVSASSYKLTNNSTHFSVEANGPGIIVLGETYYPGDFVATVNGVKVDYIRVNEASKGIWVSKAGVYDVTFTYRPERLDQAISICFIGLSLLTLLIKMSVRSSGKIIKIIIG